MSERPKLKNPPIVEAIVDLRVVPRDDLTLGNLHELHARLGEENYAPPEKQLSVTVSVSGGGEERSEKELGYIFRATDGRTAIQAQLDGFAFSQLAPYRSWENLERSARANWTHYRDVALPKRVQRLSLRFINRIFLPKPVGELRDWFPYFPEFPLENSLGMSELFLRTVTHLEDVYVIAIVGMGLPHTFSDAVPVTLDLDVISQVEFSLEDDDALWNAFARLRRVKNESFYSYISAKTIRLFD